MNEIIDYRGFEVEKDNSGGFWVLLGSIGRMYHKSYEAAIDYIDYLVEHDLQ